MNELFVLLDTMRGTAILALGLVGLVAAGMVIFAGRAKRTAAQQTEPEQVRKAA